MPKIRGKAILSTTHVMATGHPFAGTRVPKSRGPIIGIDIKTREPFHLDPVRLMDEGIIDSMWGLLIARKREGKSATLKMLTTRLMQCTSGYGSQRVMIEDHKPEGTEGEFAALGRVCQSRVFLISKMAVNPLERRLFLTPTGYFNPFGLMEVAGTLCLFGNRRVPLTGIQSTALRIGIYCMMRRPEVLWSPPVLRADLFRISAGAVRGYFLSLDRQLTAHYAQRLESLRDPALKHDTEQSISGLVAQNKNFDIPAIQHAGTEVAFMLGEVLDGPYGGMFGDQDSLYDLYRQRAVVKDWRNVNPDAETLMRILMTQIEISAVETGLTNFLPTIHLDDEKHRSMDVLEYARASSYMSEIGRSIPTIDLSATHRFDSMRKGAVGSELYRLGDRIIHNMGFVVIGRQPNRPEIIEELSDLYSLSSGDVQTLINPPKYTFGVKLGVEPMRFMRTIATPKDMAEVLPTSIATQTAMNRPNLQNPDDMRRFAEANGLVYKGE